MQNGRQSQSLFIGLLCGLSGAICVALFWLIKQDHKDYSKRWLVLLFGMMLLIASFQFVKELFRGNLSPELDDLLNSIAKTIMYGGFGILMLSSAIEQNSRIRGGIPFIPDSVNTGIGKALFAGMGIALCGVGLYCLGLTFASFKRYLASKSG